MNDFARQMMASLSALIRDRMPELAGGFKLVDISTSVNVPEIIVKMENEVGYTMLIDIQVRADEYQVLPAYARSDARTPYPKHTPWDRPHLNAIGEHCLGAPDSDGVCEEDDCVYQGRE